MSPPKEYSKPPVTGPKEMEIQELPDKEFKIIVLKMLRELEKNTNNLALSGKQYKNKMSSTKRQNT